MWPSAALQPKNGRLGGRAATWEAAGYNIKAATAQVGPLRPVKTIMRFTATQLNPISYHRFLLWFFLHSWQPGWQDPPFPKQRGPRLRDNSAPAGHHMCPTLLPLSLISFLLAYGNGNLSIYLGGEFVVHPKFRNINLLNITHSLVSQNPM